MFQNLTEKLANAFKRFRSKGKLTEADVKEGMREVKLALLEADVNFKVVKDFTKAVTERAVGAEVLESLLPAQQIIKIVNEELIKLMGSESAKINISPKPPTVVMMVGLQGAGKTTHAGKIANTFKQKGKNPLLVACDVYRPAAIDQLKIVGESIGIPVFSLGAKKSPVEIAKAGVLHARKNGFDMVFIDGDKRRYVEYYEMALSHLNVGGYILADNTLWDGHVVEEDAHDPQTLGIKAFNDVVAKDERVEKVILPLRDGLSIIKKVRG